MSCYVTKPAPLSLNDFQLWQSIGYAGTYDQYKEHKSDIGWSTMFMCGDLGKHCAVCLDFGDNLCDYPVGDGLTCDRLVCDAHGHEVAPNVHYCDGHYLKWKEFVAAGGVAAELRNVIAFKGA